MDIELWTRETGDLRPLLPRSGEWEGVDDFFEFNGDGWLVSVGPPEDADEADIPPELGDLADGVRYRVDLGVEPSNPGPEAWTLVRSTMESIGGALGGVALDPESGNARRFTH